MDVEVLRNRYGVKIGEVRSNGQNKEIYDRYGRKLGRYDGRYTYDAYGMKVGEGNLLVALLGRL